jgi:hypothetical protein
MAQNLLLFMVEAVLAAICKVYRQRVECVLLRVKSFMLAVFFSVAIGHTANATIVEFNMGGTVRSATLNTGLILPGNVENGDRWTGTIRYDTESIDTGTGTLPTYAVYNGISAFISLDFTQSDSVSEIILGYSGGGAVQVFNDHAPDSSFGDGLLINAFDNLTSTVGHTFGGNVHWFLRDSSATAFGSLEIPTSLDILDFDAPFIDIFMCAGIAGSPDALCDSFAARIDSLVQVSSDTPEPTTLAIFGIGLVGLAGMRRRRKAA